MGYATVREHLFLVRVKMFKIEGSRRRVAEFLKRGRAWRAWQREEKEGSAKPWGYMVNPVHSKVFDLSTS